jgi:hypothetical protein
MRRVLPFAAVLGIVACGSLGDAKKREPLAIIQGQLTQSTAQAPQAQVRVAVVWVSVDKRGYNVAQDVAATPVFPSKFKLELTDPPPRSAMITKATQAPPEEGPGDRPNVDPQPAPGGESGTRDHDSRAEWPADFAAAVGSVVAYEDLNGNGKLDLVEEGASSYVDRILGANETLLLVYLEGTIPASNDFTDAYGRRPTTGYSLMGMPCPMSEVPAGGGNPEPPPRTCDASNSGWLPITTLYDLPLTAEPRFAKMMCKNGGWGVSSADVAMAPPDNMPAQPASPPYPAKNEVTCSSDGKKYALRKCTTVSQGLCKGEVIQCTASYWSMPTQTPPEGWPCTVN